MSSSSSGNSFFEDVVNVTTQLGTVGLVGYESNSGGFGKGVTTEATVSALKDVTGATAMEEANADARKRFDEEKRKAQQQREEAKTQTAQDQLAASRLAAGARGGQRGTANAGNRTSRVSSLGSDERDFLGL